jgi:hypothetical protein
METEVTQAGFGFIGWLIISFVAIYILNSLKKKKDDNNGTPDEQNK